MYRSIEKKNCGNDEIKFLFFFNFIQINNVQEKKNADGL